MLDSWHYHGNQAFAPDRYNMTIINNELCKIKWERLYGGKEITIILINKMMHKGMLLKIQNQNTPVCTGNSYGSLGAA